MAGSLREFFTTSIGTAVQDGIVFSYQPLLAGNPVVGDAEFKNEAGGRPLQYGCMRLLQVPEQCPFDVVRISNEQPLPGMR